MCVCARVCIYVVLDNRSLTLEEVPYPYMYVCVFIFVFMLLYMYMYMCVCMYVVLDNRSLTSICATEADKLGSSTSGSAVTALKTRSALLHSKRRSWTTNMAEPPCKCA